MNERVALITGAASGIGRGLAVELAQRGWAIAAIDCQRERLGTLAEELTARAKRCAWGVADVTQSAELAARTRELEASLGPTDLLIACAGIGIETSGLKLNADDVARVIAANLTGVTNSIAAVLPSMLERQRGHLVALSSLASFLGLPRMLAYSASKAGLNAFMDGLRVELRPAGIHVTTICPGWIRTPMTAKLHDKIPQMLELEDAVARILRAIDRKQSFCAFPRSMTWRLRILGWLPRSWQDALVARMAREVPSIEKDANAEAD